MIRFVGFFVLLFCMNMVWSAENPHQDRLIDWLEHQATVKTWTADVTQTRTLKNLARPLINQGRLVFSQPNKFKWQVGEPAKSIAIRDLDELTIIYPKLLQAEKYPFDSIEKPAMKQALLLLEVGFPNDPQSFLGQYELVELVEEENVIFKLKPSNASAKKLLQFINLEVDKNSNTLLATELVFKDGSTMHNLFQRQKFNLALEPGSFKFDLTDYEISLPLQNQ